MRIRVLISLFLSFLVAGKKPTIVKELKAVKLQEGEEGKLEVVVSGHPKPTVAW